MEKVFEMPFGAQDSELQEVSYNIPDGFEAEVKGDKVVLRKKILGKYPKDGEKIFDAWHYANGFKFAPEITVFNPGCHVHLVASRNFFRTREECQAFCDKLNAAIQPVLEERRKELEE